MTVFAIPNRPAGTDVRNIADLMDNFDAIINALNAKLVQGANINAAAITENLISSALKKSLGFHPDYYDIGSNASGLVVNSGSPNTTAGPFASVVLTGPTILLVSMGADVTSPSAAGMTVVFDNGVRLAVGSTMGGIICPTAGTYNATLTYNVTFGSNTYSNRVLRLMGYAL